MVLGIQLTCLSDRLAKQHLSTDLGESKGYRMFFTYKSILSEVGQRKGLCYMLCGFRRRTEPTSCVGARPHTARWLC